MHNPRSDDAHVEISMNVPEGTCVQITIQTVDNQKEPAGISHPVITSPTGVRKKPTRPFWTVSLPAVPVLLTRLRAFSKKRVGTAVFSNPTYLFGISIAIYILIQFAGLTVYPAHFSCDEAVSVVNTSRLLQNQMYYNGNTLLPTFFKNDNQFSLSTTVYLSILPYLLFGKSIWVVRATAGLVALLGALWLTLFLRNMLRLPAWWSGALLLSLTPAWFFLARTGLETSQMAAFYAGFWYFYARYRFKSPGNLYAALILGALAFYTYTPGQIIMVVSGLILLAVDARYHWIHRQTTWKGLLLLILLAAPLVRFWILEPQAYLHRLDMYSSYLTAPDFTPWQKIRLYLREYLKGLSPVFWFSPHLNEQHMRYALGSHPPIPWIYAPPILAGLVAGLRKWKANPEMRLPFYALLAAPTGAAVVVDPTLPRLLATIIPLVVFAALGLSAALQWSAGRGQTLRVWTAPVLLLMMAGSGIFTLLDATTNGALWIRDYGLDGLQWGAPQVYRAALDHLKKRPADLVMISPNWTFQGKTLLDFFAEDNSRILVRNVADYMQVFEPEISRIVFIVTPEDFSKVKASKKFLTPEILRTIAYPDGRDGFYMLRLTYVNEISEILEAERIERHKPLQETLLIEEQQVIVHYSALDMGEISNLFDGNPETVARTAGSNPFILGLDFPQPRTLRGISLHAGAEPVTVTVEVLEPSGRPLIFKTKSGLAPGLKDIEVNFGSRPAIKSLKILLYDDDVPEPASVHLWEVRLLP